MSLPNIVEAAKADLYTPKDELLTKYAQPQVDHLLRLRIFGEKFVLGSVEVGFSRLDNIG